MTGKVREGRLVKRRPSREQVPCAAGQMLFPVFRKAVLENLSVYCIHSIFGHFRRKVNTGRKWPVHCRGDF